MSPAEVPPRKRENAEFEPKEPPRRRCVKQGAAMTTEWTEPLRLIAGIGFLFSGGKDKGQTSARRLVEAVGEPCLQ